MSNMVVRTNVMSLNSHRNLGMVGNQQRSASSRLSSGFRINSAADDAAGLGISEKMRAQIRGLDQASRNGQDGISLIQTAEGAMSTINDMVTRIRELVVQASNDTNAHDETDAATWSQSDRTRIQDEINQLMSEIDATADRTQFNTRNLIDGSLHGLSPSARAALNDIVGAQQAQITNLNNARTNLAQTDAAISVMQTNANLLSEVQAVLNSVMGASNINAILQNNNFATAAAAATGLNTLLAEQLNATGLFNLAANTLQFVAGDFSAPVGTAGNEAVRSLSGAGATAADGARRDQAVVNWYANAGAGLTLSVTPGTAAAGAPGGGTEVVLTAVTTWELVGTQLTAARTALNTAWPPLRAGQITAANTATNNLNTALRNNAVLSREISDWNTAESMLGNPGAQALWFHIGGNVAQGVNLSIANVNVNELNRVGNFAASGVELGFNFTNLRTNGTSFADRGTGVMRENGEDINKFLTAIDFALSHVTAERSNLGAMQNRLEFTIENLDIASENLSAAESRIRDADMALEMMRLTQANVLQQAATSMLAQANQAPQSVLQLLG